MRPGLIVMARRPVLGRVKSRLAASIGEEAALTVYRKLLEHVRATVHTARHRWGFAYGWWITDTADRSWSQHFDPEADAHYLQVAGDLGTRMEAAFRQAFERWSPVVMIGSDVPDLDPDYLGAAFAALAEREAVLGPAADGGFVLVGLRRLPRFLFADLPWGSDRAFSETLTRFATYGWRTYILPMRHDLDTAADLARFPQFQPGEETC